MKQSMKIAKTSWQQAFQRFYWIRMIITV